MPDIEQSVVVARPPAEVFAFVADLRNHEQMLPSTYTDYRVTSERPEGLGARMEYKIGLMGKEYPTATEITVYQPPQRLVERAPTRTEFWNEWRFESADGGGSTRVTLRTVYTPGGGFVGVLLDPFLGRRRTQQSQTQQLDRLKRALEAGGADGDPA